MIYYENTVPVSLDVNANIYSINVNIDAVTIEQDLGIDTAIQVVTGDHYDGPVEVTPSQDVQILETQGLFTDDNIRINPIPSNYGLITWDGSVLTVS